MKRYEYKVLIRRITVNEEKVLSQLGAEGWQLVTVENHIFYFMREVKEGE